MFPMYKLLMQLLLYKPALANITTVLFSLAALISWLAVPAQMQVILARAGVVQRVKGEVVLHCHNENETELLKPGIRLCDGDLVFTTADAAAEWSLTPDSYLTVSANTHVRIHKTDLGQMDFDVERGEVILIIKTLSNGAALALHTPPALLQVNKSGSYLIRVFENKETEAVVVEGELRYVNKAGKEERVKKGRKVFFYRDQK